MGLKGPLVQKGSGGGQKVRRGGRTPNTDDKGVVRLWKQSRVIPGAEKQFRRFCLSIGYYIEGH